MGHDDAAMNADAAVRQGFSRREMLQRGGFVVGAAALWATPVVQTVGMRPAAATDEFENEACVDGNGNLLGAPASLTFQLVPSACNSTLDESYKTDPDSPWAPDNENETVFYGDCCDLSGESGPFKVEVGGVGGLNNFPNNQMTEIASSPLAASASFTVTRAQLQSASNIFFRISPVGDPSCEQRFGFHFSCSEPLIIGDRHGSVKITGYTA